MPPTTGPGRPGSASATRDTGTPATDASTHAAAFFDVDNTIIRGASAFHLIVELRRRNLITIGDIAFFARHALSYALAGEDTRQIGTVLERALQVIRGASIADLLAVAEDVYDETLEARIFPGTRDILERHWAAGHQVWLVTAGPQEVAELIARRLGATGAVGTVAESRDGVLTGRLAGPLMHGRQKAVAARAIAEREGFDLADCFAYGDSVSDVPMLAEVGYPCAVNPEPRLRQHCAAVGWPVRDVHRKRSTVGRKAGNAAAAAVVSLALGVAVRALRVRHRSTSA